MAGPALDDAGIHIPPHQDRVVQVAQVMEPDGRYAGSLAEFLEIPHREIVPVKWLAVGLAEDQVPVVPLLAVLVPALATLFAQAPLEAFLDMPPPQYPQGVSQPPGDQDGPIGRFGLGVVKARAVSSLQIADKSNDVLFDIDVFPSETEHFALAPSYEERGQEEEALGSLVLAGAKELVKILSSPLRDGRPVAAGFRPVHAIAWIRRDITHAKAVVQEPPHVLKDLAGRRRTDRRESSNEPFHS